jgi:hypothetical protein
MLLVKPLSGRRVRHPDSKQVLDESGCRISSVTSYWHRRQKDGDVSISEISESAAPAVEKKSRKSESEG